MNALTTNDKKFLKKLNQWFTETLTFELNKDAVDSENIIDMIVYIEDYFCSTTELFNQIEKRTDPSMIYEDHIERVYDRLQPVLHKMSKIDQEKTLLMFQSSYGISDLNSIHQEAHQARKEALAAMEG